MNEIEKKKKKEIPLTAQRNHTAINESENVYHTSSI